jgi:cyclopropane-fatty-acyl-phospholipid synthase
MDMMNIDKLNEKYDAIMSIEAIEHIKDFDTLFKKSSKILSKNGKALFQTAFNHIHHDFDTWNGKYMWPGIKITSRKRLLDSCAKNFETISFTQYKKLSYSKTFMCWLQNFIDNEKKLLSILDKANSKEDNEIFIRKFKYYLQCCVAVYKVYMDVGFALCDNEKVKL